MSLRDRVAASIARQIDTLLLIVATDNLRRITWAQEAALDDDERALRDECRECLSDACATWFEAQSVSGDRINDELTRRAESVAIPVRGHPNPQYMFPGDKVEFLSDIQTEKGPSAGICVDNPNGQDLAIEHSDCVEWFDAIDLRVERVSRTHDGFVLWTLS